MKLLEIKNLNVSFIVDKKPVHILNDVSIDINENEVMAVIGETGCGKSVTGSSVLRVLPENAVITGTVLYKGKDVVSMGEKDFRLLRGKEIAAVPQSPSTSLDPLMRIGEQVAECVTNGKSMAGREKNILKEKIFSIFSQLSMPREKELYSSYPCELSGGMRQRVLISMGVITKPNLLIVDEPTKAIDWALRKEVVEIMRKLKEEIKCSMMFITHDLAAAGSIADKIAVMYCGEVVEIGSVKEVLKEPKHPYTKGLIDAMPSKGFKVMNGFMPSFSEIPKGCRFHTRCVYKKEICGTVVPKEILKNGVMVKCHLFNGN